MTKTRLLLPFTYGVDADALTRVLLFARASQSQLVGLALIPVAPKQNKVRLERLDQAQDFLEMLVAKAASYGVSVEQHECFTSDVLSSLQSSQQAMDCQSILLVFDGEGVCFLEKDEAREIQQRLATSLYVLHMPPKAQEDM